MKEDTKIEISKDKIQQMCIQLTIKYKLIEGWRLSGIDRDLKFQVNV